MIKVEFTKCRLCAKEPTRGTSGSACWDLYAAEDAEVVSSHVSIVCTGLKVAVPQGFCMSVRPRSGLSIEGLVIPNAPGTIDSDYRGEVLVPMISLTGRTHYVKCGDRIAQIMLTPIYDLDWVLVCDLDLTDRGEGGFGSTEK